MTDHRRWRVLPHQPLFFFISQLRSLTTPLELLPYGRMTTDLWCAPVITGLYATLTHAQPFWADVHAILGVLAGGRYADEARLEPPDTETACARCVLVLVGLFVMRAVKTFSVGSFSKGRYFRCCLL